MAHTCTGKGDSRSRCCMCPLHTFWQACHRRNKPWWGWLLPPLTFSPCSSALHGQSAEHRGAGGKDQTGNMRENRGDEVESIGRDKERDAWMPAQHAPDTVAHHTAQAGNSGSRKCCVLRVENLCSSCSRCPCRDCCRSRSSNCSWCLYLLTRVEHMFNRLTCSWCLPSGAAPHPARP